MYRIIKILFTLFLGVLLLAASGCKEYVFGPEPHFINEREFTPRLNVFGVLRTDSLYGKPASLVRVDNTIHVDSVETDTTVITGARVTIYEMGMNHATDTFHFVYTDYDSTYTVKDYRPRNFVPQANTSYQLRCEKEGYETVTGYTTVPEKPELIDGVKTDDRQLKFEIKRRENAILYEFYLMKARDFHYDKKLRPDSGNVKVNISLPEGFTKPFELKIYAYDTHLSEYNTYSLYYKPNTYQPPYSTVENGYGCFGSMNVLRVRVE